MNVTGVSGLWGHPGTSAEVGILFHKPLWVLLWSSWWTSGRARAQVSELAMVGVVGRAGAWKSVRAECGLPLSMQHPASPSS